MSRKRSRHNGYGEKWAVAVSLMDGPCSINEIEHHFSSIARRFGFFSIDSIVKKSHEKSLKDWLIKMLIDMQEIKWVTKENDIYKLTNLGMNEAEKAYKESFSAKEFLDKLTSASMVSKVTFYVHIMLSLIKIPAAILSSSVGLLSDSLDTLADALSSMFVFIGIKKNKENLANVFLVILMIVTGGLTLYKAITRVFNPILPDVDIFTFVAVILSAVICLVLYLYQRYTGIKTKTLALITQSVDSRNHVFAAISVIVGLIAVKLNFVWLDVFVGLVVAFLICKSAIELFIELIKNAKGGEVEIFKSGFSIYDKYRKRELSVWMLRSIDNFLFKDEDELINYAKEKLDTKGNRTLKAFDKDEYIELESDILKCINELKEKEYIIIDEKVEITNLGKRHITKTDRTIDKRGRKIIKVSILVIYYMLEFTILTYAIRYISNILGASELWMNVQVNYMSILSIAVSSILYVYARYHFKKICRIHRHLDKTRLKTDGYYLKSRHPMYGMMASFQIAILSSIGYRWAALFSLFIFLLMNFNAFFEERALIKLHGDKYIDYMKNTKNRLMSKLNLAILIILLVISLLGLFF